MEQYPSCGKLVGEFHTDVAHLELTSSDHSLNHIGCNADLLCVPAPMLFLYDKE